MDDESCSMNSFRCQNLRYSCQCLLRRQELPITRSELGNIKLERSHLNARTIVPFASRAILFLLFRREKHYNLTYSESCNLANRYSSDPLLVTSILFQSYSLSLLSFHYLYQLCYLIARMRINFSCRVTFSQDMLSN